jgi:integrase
MLAIPENVLARFNEVLKQRAVPESVHVHYRKWLRYFFDFCEKYTLPTSKSEQVRHLISHVEYPFDIVVSLLYGCGLRLFECIGLRVQNFKSENRILPVHGKGEKDRTVPLPQRLIPRLKTQLAVVSELHDKDMADGFADIFLVDSLEKKYPAAAKDFIWQWFFPQKGLTQIPGTKELRRYHLHESQVQEALKIAVRKAKLTKRVKSHTFRHRFATHLCRLITI